MIAADSLGEAISDPKLLGLKLSAKQQELAALVASHETVIAAAAGKVASPSWRLPPYE